MVIIWFLFNKITTDYRQNKIKTTLFTDPFVPHLQFSLRDNVDDDFLFLFF